MNYAISMYSKHPNQAFEAAMRMRNEKNAPSAALDAADVPSLATCSTNDSARRAR